MDRNTLSRYGWIVVVALIFAVMLAFATPFGKFAGKTFLAITSAYIDVGTGATSEENLQKHEDMWNEEIAGLKGDSQAVVKNKIPDGGTYYTGVTTNQTGNYMGATKVYNSGETLPDNYTPVYGDVFVYGDYEYRYNSNYGYPVGSMTSKWMLNETQNGWGVKVKNASQASYGPLLESIIGKPLKATSYAFWSCKSVTDFPEIPDSVTNMESIYQDCVSLVSPPALSPNATNIRSAFNGCTSLRVAPIIPDTVINMNNTFSRCANLTQAPAIPSQVTNLSYAFASCTSLTVPPDMSKATSVTNMGFTFTNCTALKTAPVIPNSVTSMDSTFYNCRALTTGSTIPSNVTDVHDIFASCTSLIGRIEINANPTTYFGCFGDINFSSQNLTLVGSSTMLDTIGTAGTINYCATCNGTCSSSH